MKITYTCEICGNTSGSIAKISACELKGAVRKFKPRLKVRALYDSHTGLVVEGTIYKIWFVEETHYPLYTILIDDQNRKKIGLIGFSNDPWKKILSFGCFTEVGYFNKEHITPI